MTTPPQDLSKTIVDRLVQAKLVLAADAEVLARLLAEGKAKEDDWRLALEKAQAKEHAP